MSPTFERSISWAEAPSDELRGQTVAQLRDGRARLGLPVGDATTTIVTLLMKRTREATSPHLTRVRSLTPSILVSSPD